MTLCHRAVLGTGHLGEKVGWGIPRVFCPGGRLWTASLGALRHLTSASRALAGVRLAARLIVLARTFLQIFFMGIEKKQP